MKKSALIFVLGYLGATFQVNAQKKDNIDNAFLRRLAHDARLIIANYNNVSIKDSLEKNFVIQMKQAANATKWADADRRKFITGIKVLASDLGLFANPDEGGEIEKKKAAATDDPANPDEGGEITQVKIIKTDDPANPDEGGEIFIKGTDETYHFYRRLFQKFNISENLAKNGKLFLATLK